VDNWTPAFIDSFGTFTWLYQPATTDTTHTYTDTTYTTAAYTDTIHTIEFV